MYLLLKKKKVLLIILITIVSIERKFLKLKLIKSYCVKERLSEFIRLWLGKKLLVEFFFKRRISGAWIQKLISNLINI